MYHIVRAFTNTPTYVLPFLPLRFYKNHAIDFSRVQVCVDTFLFAGQYTDVATLAVLSKYTAGSTYYYPAYAAARDGESWCCAVMRVTVGGYTVCTM